MLFVERRSVDGGESKAYRDQSEYFSLQRFPDSASGTYKIWIVWNLSEHPDIFFFWQVQ